MCLEHAHDPHARGRGGVEVLLDREGRIDDDRLAGVADEVRAAEIVVDELPKDHTGTLTNIAGSKKG